MISIQNKHADAPILAVQILSGKSSLLVKAETGFAAGMVTWTFWCSFAASLTIHLSSVPRCLDGVKAEKKPMQKARMPLPS